LEFSLPSLIYLEKYQKSKTGLRVSGHADQVMHDHLLMNCYFDLATFHGWQQLRELHLQLPSNHLRMDQGLPAKALL
jgi:hypothetical protein